MILALKLLLTPLLIGLASIVQGRRGGLAGGLLAGLPLTSAPVSVFLALEHGPAFAARAAIGTLLGVVAMSAFCAVYARSAHRLRWPVSLFLAAVTCAAMTVLMSLVPQDLRIAAAVAFPSLIVLSIVTGLGGGPVVRVEPRWWDTPARMVTAGVAVVLITAFATIVGPTWSGLLATLPVFAAVMGVFSHRNAGPHAARSVLHGIAVGALGSAAFFCVVAAFVGHARLPVAYSAAIVVALASAAFGHAAFSWRREGERRFA